MGCLDGDFMGWVNSEVSQLSSASCLQIRIKVHGTNWLGNTGLHSAFCQEREDFIPQCLCISQALKITFKHTPFLLVAVWGKSFLFWWCLMKWNTYLGYSAIIRQCQVLFPRMKVEKREGQCSRYEVIKWRIWYCKKNWWQWYFPSLDGHLSLGLLLVVFKWFSKALQSEKGCFSLSFTEYIRHTAWTTFGRGEAECIWNL